MLLRTHKPAHRHQAASGRRPAPSPFPTPSGLRDASLVPPHTDQSNNISTPVKHLAPMASTSTSKGGSHHHGGGNCRRGRFQALLLLQVLAACLFLFGLHSSSSMDGRNSADSLGSNSGSSSSTRLRAAASSSSPRKAVPYAIQSFPHHQPQRQQQEQQQEQQQHANNDLCITDVDLEASVHSPGGHHVIIASPLRNGREYLPAFLAALSGQTYPPEQLTVVVYDDDSDDGGPEYLAAQAPLLPFRLLVLRGEARRGPAYAKWRLIQHIREAAAGAEGGVRRSPMDLVLFLDADDKVNRGVSRLCVCVCMCVYMYVYVWMRTRAFNTPPPPPPKKKNSWRTPACWRRSTAGSRRRSPGSHGAASGGITRCVGWGGSLSGLVDGWMAGCCCECPFWGGSVGLLIGWIIRSCECACVGVCVCAFILTHPRTHAPVQLHIHTDLRTHAPHKLPSHRSGGVRPRPAHHLHERHLLRPDRPLAVLPPPHHAGLPAGPLRGKKKMRRRMRRKRVLL